MMSITEAIYEHSRRLPEFAAQEALDFIVFLEQRYAERSPILEDDAKRQKLLAHLASVHIHWDGKPISDRNALYDEVRG